MAQKHEPAFARQARLYPAPYRVGVRVHRSARGAARDCRRKSRLPQSSQGPREMPWNPASEQSTNEDETRVRRDGPAHRACLLPARNEAGRRVVAHQRRDIGRRRKESAVIREAVRTPAGLGYHRSSHDEGQRVSEPAHPEPPSVGGYFSRGTINLLVGGAQVVAWAGLISALHFPGSLAWKVPAGILFC